MTGDRVKLPGGSGVEFKLATREDFKDFYGEYSPWSAKGFIFFKDDKPVGFGGYKIENNVYILFSDIKEDAILSKATIARAAMIVASLANDVDRPIYAASPNKRLCEFTGGVKVDDVYYKWEK